MWKAKILDGRGRWRACQDLNIEPTTREWDGNGSPAEFVVSLNSHLRHLTPSQLAACAVGTAELLALLTGVQALPTAAYEGESRDLFAWFVTHRNRRPHKPYALAPAVKVTDPARFYSALAKDIAVGPRGARAMTGVLAADLYRLRDLVGKEIP
jgi:hypothetical protein